LVVASEELNVYPSELEVSMASDISEPALAATCDVMSTSRHTPLAVGVKVVTTAPLAGRLLYVRVPSAQLSSATCFRLWTPPELLLTNMRSLPSETFRPPSACRSNFI
jgi:hypothetical protein